MSQQHPQDQPPWGYPQKDLYSPHVQTHGQQHVPEQWQGKPGYGQQTAQWKPPEVGYWTYPGNPEPEPERRPRPERRTPPYPSHLTRFPSELLGFSSKRRSRGPSFWRMVYLGTHPLALLMTIILFMLMLEVIAGWVFTVIALWLAWCCVVTIGWGLHVAWSAASGGHRGRLRPLAPRPQAR